ncbi:hypothetical protein K458DRAFT_384295, partial [Lentithecium fluviatile CBS 122367]
MASSPPHQSDLTTNTGTEAGSHNRGNRFACPFYKRDPIQHPRCSKALLTKMSYVKQHLLRNHRMPPYCKLCGEEFHHEDELLTHVREESCQGPILGRPRGMSRSQELALHKRSDQKLRADEQWYEVFRLLFPGEQLPHSPYAPDMSNPTQELPHTPAERQPGGRSALPTCSSPTQSLLPSDMARQNPPVAIQGAFIPQSGDKLQRESERQAWCQNKSNNTLDIPNGYLNEFKHDNSRTPLSWAAEKGSETVVRLLLEKGADMESQDNNGRTPLSWAVGKGSEA